MYFAHLYENYITGNSINIYSHRLKKLPAPQYFVLYNGTEAMPARQTLRLSDAFETQSDSLECIARVINLNDSSNAGLFERCKPLSEYMTFVNTAQRLRNEGKSLEEAVDAAVDYCIANDVLKEILLKDKEGVRNVLLAEFNEEAYKKDWVEEGWREGMLSAFYGLVRDNVLTLEQAAQRAQVSVESFKEGYLQYCR